MNAQLSSDPLSTLAAVGAMLVLGFATYWLGTKAVRALP
jgi:hypothetical protein